MEEEKKIYIGNLKFNLTEEDIQKTLQEKGLTPKDVRVIRDKFSGRSKGFGFAEFETEEQVEQAINILNELDLDGRPLRVSKALKMKPKNEGHNYSR